MPWYRLLAAAVLAGAFLSLAAVGANTAACMIENPSLSKLVSALVFPVGLVMILLAGSELFTGNCLLILPVMQKEMKLRHMIRCWLLVYAGNFVGAVLIAFLISRGNQFSLFGGELAVATIKTAVKKTSLSFESGLIFGILCNFLVCTAVWINCAGKTVTDKIAGMYLPVVLFVLSGYEHSIANMYYIPAGMLAMGNPTYAAMAAEHGINVTGMNMQNFIFGNLVPVTLGNIIGGGVFVGFMYLMLMNASGDSQHEVS